MEHRLFRLFCRRPRMVGHILLDRIQPTKPPLHRHHGLCHRLIKHKATNFQVASNPPPRLPETANQTNHDCPRPTLSPSLSCRLPNRSGAALGQYATPPLPESHSRAGQTAAGRPNHLPDSPAIRPHHCPPTRITQLHPTRHVPLPAHPPPRRPRPRTTLRRPARPRPARLCRPLRCPATRRIRFAHSRASAHLFPPQPRHPVRLLSRKSCLLAQTAKPHPQLLALLPLPPIPRLAKLPH